MVEILLDPAIRLWVIIPIVLISLMFGLVRHYVTILIKSEKPADLTQLKDGCVNGCGQTILPLSYSFL